MSWNKATACGVVISIDDVIAAARRLLHPYTLDVQEVVWWSAYEIGQRLCDRFDDLESDGFEAGEPSVFVVGDDGHNHFPKAGQGMNVPIQGAFNLGWKLASVPRGRSPPRLLRTCSDERQMIARELIEFDREWVAILSVLLQLEDHSDGVEPWEVEDYYLRSGRYTASTATHY